MTMTVNAARNAELAANDTITRDFVTIAIAGQSFGIPVLQVQDVLRPQKITPIPLAPPAVAGSLNLRGRIVTALDVRRRLGLPAYEADTRRMSTVVEFGGDLYSLIVDEVGEVMSLADADFERNPPTLDTLWRDISAGVYRLEDQLLVVLDVARLLSFVQTEKAA